MSLAAVSLVFLFFGALPVFAAEEHAASVTQLLVPLANFLIFLYIIKRFAGPAVGDYLRSRRQRLLAALEEAAREKQRAEDVRQDYERRLAGSADEARTLIETLRGDGERQRTKISSDAEELARKIVADAQFQAEQEGKLARQRLRRELAQAARDKAEELIRRHLAPGDQDRLVTEFLSQLRGQR
jgi:F-type H+-transporting ATPase subunit b